MPEIEPGLHIGDLQRLTSLDLLEARMLISFALSLTRVQLITQSERTITAEEAARIRNLFSRRLQGEPIAYIIGMREFYGLEFCVTPDVLIPRPETELLVDLALERLPDEGNVLDMGTGSGAIPVAIAHERPDAIVTALDVSVAALDVARNNADNLLGGALNQITFMQSDWYGSLGENQRFSLIVANPPYIQQDDIHLQQGDLRFEPPDALTDHSDGLSALRQIVSGAPHHLKPAAWLLMEHGFDQAAAVRELLLADGFGQVQSWRDLANLERVTGGIWGG